ncbi:MAG: DEAD/DEAH box helicase family protein, partial [Elusimicrobia bacterium]|nr:DEAD/DEAH box helicase family protein [Elusimicrobiota bacterium]
EKNTDAAKALNSVKAAFPTVEDFERHFPSLCFALATGVGKTRLMGAFIAYLYKAEGIRHFFVLAPNLTIYNKLIADFTPNTPKYVFQGIAEFAVNPPEIITGDNYESGRGVREEARKQRSLPGMAAMDGAIHVNIFNISKITSIETPKGAAKTNVPRFRRLQEYIGESYFEYLSKLDDLVLLMDESHRYRASAGMKAIEELNPILGLELTATPQVERGGKTQAFKNVIYGYPLSSAMEDGFVKEPAVATRENFDARNYKEEKLERLKLEDGIRLHENTRVELEVYARDNGKPLIKPFMLVIARDTRHADALLKQMEDKSFFEGSYKGKIIVVHSNLKGEEKDETVEQLMNVEKADNPTEIVVHVNMLKEGWDVTNLYTIVPLRAANSKTLVEQSIGRGLRLPYGKRTGVGAVDRLTIVAHDKFQEIVDYANSPESIIRGGLKTVYVSDERTKAVVVPPELFYRINGNKSADASHLGETPPLFDTSHETNAANAALEVIHREFERLPSAAELSKPEIQKQIVKKVEEIIAPKEGELKGIAPKVDLAKVVAKTTELYQELSINIPCITVQPVGNVERGYKEFKLDLSQVRYQPVEHEILIQELHKREQHRLLGADGVFPEERPEDYLVRELMNFDDVNYDEHSKLLYALAAQAVKHLKSYLKGDEAVLNVLQYHQHPLAELIHAQMQEHFVDKAASYETVVTKSFQTLRPTNYSAPTNEKGRDIHSPVSDKQGIGRMLFTGFKKCLYRVQKFDSDPERRFAVLLENDKDAMKWFRPTKGDLRIYYSGEASYEPDFVVEAKAAKYLCEVKRASEMSDKVVQAKAKAAAEWCRHASEHELKNSGKPWSYLLIPDDAVAENKTLNALAASHAFRVDARPMDKGLSEWSAPGSGRIPS